MAHNPVQEDFRRMYLRYISKNNVEHPRELLDFPHLYAKDPESLPQTDEDRAFHVVIKASGIIDRTLPFVEESKAEELEEQGEDLLHEALMIDPLCPDAMRMLASHTLETTTEFLDFLITKEPDIKNICMKRIHENTYDTNPVRNSLWETLSMYPHQRWLASMAQSALICGRYRSCLKYGHQLLDEDPFDVSDVSLTLALAYAKLEDESGFERLEYDRQAHVTIYRKNNPWNCLARLSLAYKRFDYDRARQELTLLLNTAHSACAILLKQGEFPEAEFARLAVRPDSEDELVLAVSEGIILLQEGADPTGKGTLGSWIVREISQLLFDQGYTELPDFENMPDNPNDFFGNYPPQKL